MKRRKCQAAQKIVCVVKIKSNFIFFALYFSLSTYYYLYYLSTPIITLTMYMSCLLEPATIYIYYAYIPYIPQRLLIVYTIQLGIHMLFLIPCKQTKPAHTHSQREHTHIEIFCLPYRYCKYIYTHTQTQIDRQTHMYYSQPAYDAYT